MPAVVMDAERTVLLANAAAEQLSPGPLDGPCHALLLGHGAPCDPCILGEALVGEGSAIVAHHDLAPALPQRTVAIALTDTDGSRYVVEVVPPVADPGDHPGGAIQEEAIRSTLEVGSDAVLYFDVRLAVVLANQVAGEVFGCTAADLGDRTLVDLGILESADVLAGLFRNSGSHLATRRPVVLRRRDGATAPAESRFTLLIGSPGRLVGACSFVPPASWTWTVSSPVAVTEPALAAAKPRAGHAPDDDDYTPLPMPAPMVAPIATLRSRVETAPVLRAVVSPRDPTPPPARLAVAETIPPAPAGVEPPTRVSAPLEVTAPDSSLAPLPEVVVLIAGEPLRISAITDEVTALLGHPPEGFMGLLAEAWFDKVHEPELAAELREMWRGLAGQQFELHALPEQVVSYPFRRADGTLVTCRTVWRAIQDGEGWFRGVELLIRPER